MRKPLRVLLNRLGNRSVPLWVGRLKHRLLVFFGQKPVLVYTMGKVGSLTVVRSLNQSGISSLVYHVHFLSDANLARIEKTYEGAGKPRRTGIRLTKLLTGELDHLSSSRILSGMRLRRALLVSMVRDPIDTFFSHVFQNPAVHRPFLLKPDGTLSRSALESYIGDSFHNFDSSDDYISNWFNDEFFRYCGVDVYAHPFDRSSGYGIIREGSWKIAIVALEHLDQGLPAAISALIGKGSNLEIINANIRTDTEDRELYRDIKAAISIPPECLRRVYSTRYAQHFFSQDHIDKMTKKWTNTG